MSETKYAITALRGSDQVVQAVTMTSGSSVLPYISADIWEQAERDLARMLDAIEESRTYPRYSSKEDAEQNINQIMPVIRRATIYGYEDVINPVWLAAKYSIKREPVERVIPFKDLQ